MTRRIYMRNRLLELIQAKQQQEKRLIPQRELAARLGISVNTLKKWIKQEVKMYDETVVERIYDYFDIHEPNDLFYFEEVEATE